MDQLWKIRRHHWKKRLKISKSAKVKSDTSQESEDIAQQSCEHLQTFVWWGASLTPPPPRAPTRKIVAKKRKKIYCQYGLKQHPAGRTSFACLILILVYSRTKDCKNRERSHFVAHELQVAKPRLRLTYEQALRDAMAAGRELNESLQLRLWYLNISNEKIDAKCWLEDMIIGMASLLLARVFQCLFTFTFDFASPSRWLAEIWQLTRSGFTEW